MLYYPKIPGSRGCPSGRCLAFEKYDGTNLHWCWNRDFGWHSFGTRRESHALLPVGLENFARTHAHLRQAPEVFESTLARAVGAVLRSGARYESVENVTVFTEFVGMNSFAGLHKHEDTKQLILFDVLAEPFGMVGPDEFVADFGHLDSLARVVYRGKLTGKFCDDVRQGKYEVQEGVICKGVDPWNPWMIKIKTHAYMENLKKAFAENWENYWE